MISHITRAACPVGHSGLKFYYDDLKPAADLGAKFHSHRQYHYRVIGVLNHGRDTDGWMDGRTDVT